MNWIQQLALAFHLLNNAVLLAVGTLGYCELRRRFHDRLPGWARPLVYGVLFAAFGIFTSFAPAITVAGFAVSLRFVALIIATLYCGLASGAVATLVLAAFAVYTDMADPMQGWGWPIFALAGFAIAAAYRLVVLRHSGLPRPAQLLVVTLAIAVVTLGEIVWLRGGAIFVSAFAIAGPAWTVMLLATVVALGTIIRHFEQTHALAAAVAQNEQRFRGFYNESPVMLTAIDGAGRVVAVTDRWLETLGYRREEVIGRNRYDFLAPDSAAYVNDHVLPSLRAGEPRSDIDLQLIRKDGGLVDITSTAVRREDPVTGAEEILNFAVDQTARRRTERALEESESDLRAIIDHSPVGIFLKDSAGRYRLMNRRFEQWIGDASVKRLGLIDADFMPPEVAEEIRSADLSVLEHGRIHQVERRPKVSQCPDEHILITKFPIRDAAGRITGIAGFAVDVTERKRAEAALRDSRELLVEAQRLGKVGHIFVDRVAKRVYWSDSVFELRGVPHREFFSFEEAIGFIHPDDQPSYEAARESAIAEHRDFKLDVRILRPDGSQSWEHSVGRPRYDEAGNCIGLLVVLRDVTESKRAEEALKQKEAQLRAIMDNAPVAIYLKNCSGHYQIVNRCYTDWFGHRPEEIVGHTSTEVYPSEIADFIERIDAQVSQEGKIAVVDWPRMSDKTIIGHLQVTQFPIRDERGIIVGSAGFCVDITERKSAELALAESRELLIESQRLGKIGHLVSDRRTGRVYWSDTLCELRGVPKHDFLTYEQSKASPFIHPEDRPKFEDARDGGIAERRDFKVDIRTLRPNGSFAWESVVGRPRYDREGKLESILYVLQDITERKLADEALRRKEAELRAIMDHAPLAIFLKDRDGRYRLVNRCYSQWMQRSPDDVYGRTSAEVFAPEIAAGMESRDRLVIERGEISVAEIPTDFIDRRFGIQHNLITKFPVRDEAGEIVGIAGFAMDITAGKRAEMELRETQQRLQAILDNAPFAIFLKDSDGRYQLINRTFTDWFGERPEEVIGRTAMELYPAEQVRKWEVVDREILRTGRVAQEERGVLKAKPEIEHVLVTKFPIRDERGGATGFAGIIADITNRKRTEIALGESRQLLLESQRLGKLGYVVAHAPSNRVVWSETLFELRGLPPRESFTFEETWEFIHPDDRVEYLEVRDAALAARRDLEFDYRALHGDGSYGWEHAIVQFRFDANGGYVGSLALVQDISDRKQAEQALQQSEERFRSLIEHSNDMVTVVTRDGRITYRSPSSAEMFGFTHDQVIGSSIFERIHEADAEGIRAGLQALQANADVRPTGRSRIRHKDGTWRTLAWSARDASAVPGINGIIINSRDVTEAQQLEERLRESQKMEAIGQLAGGIAHDFNNLLGAILGFSSFLLQDLPEESPEHGFAERIALAGERGRDLVQQILTFSRRSGVERRPTDLATLAAETRDLLRASIPSSTRLEMTIDEEGLVADVNAGQIGQVLLNLCLNANDALGGEPGRIAVSLSRGRESDIESAFIRASSVAGAAAADEAASSIVVGALRPGRLYACLAVADTGVGIAAKTLRRIFDPFFTTKKRGRGTGLGLSVVHGIVMEYEGALLVTSRPQAGSIFKVYLPLVAEAPEPAEREEAEISLRGSERVLVVDDEAVITDVLATALRRLGYAVVAVNDPEDAITAVTENPLRWDLVISDQVMPGMKGLALLERLKSIRSSLPFILHTGFSDDATEASALAAGVDALILKPALPREIAAVMRRLFDRPVRVAE